MAKVQPVYKPDNRTLHGWMVRCPVEQCHAHLFDLRWTFNGDLEKPTFRASMLSWAELGPERRMHRCHSYVTDGRIQFLDDCTHALKGQTVDLPDWDDLKGKA